MSLNRILDFDGRYQAPPMDKAGVRRLYAGFATAAVRCVAHNALTYKLSAMSGSGALRRYAVMAATDVVCYPLDTVRRRQMLTGQRFEDALCDLTTADKGG